MESLLHDSANSLTNDSDDSLKNDSVDSLTNGLADRLNTSLTIDILKDNLLESKTSKPLKIGIDFGGVCCYLTRDDNDDTQKYDPNFKESITMEGCVDALKYLVKQGHTLYLISFCGKNRANATRNMLCTEHSDLFKKENLFFVKRRWYKSKVCNHLGLDVLIDDRIDIITSLRHVKGIQFRGDPRIDKNNTELEHKFLTADSWKDVISILDKFESLNLNPREEIDISALCHWEKTEVQNIN